jgi:hypothetical protein
MKPKKSKKESSLEKVIFNILPKDVVEEFFDQQRLGQSDLVKKNIDMIDDCINDLAKSIGRELTSNEEEAILDIVDELSPKDEDGFYLTELIPFDYAWKVYKARIFYNLNKVIDDNNN